MPRTWPTTFEVAFSFAGEQRDLVKQIALEVERQIGRGQVFLDEWYEHVISGHDADIELQRVYGSSKMVVVCISQEYGQKKWTKLEHEKIRELLMQLRESTNATDRLRILPIRVGDGDVLGIPQTAICPDARLKSISETALMIVERLNLIRLQSAASEFNSQRHTAIPSQITTPVPLEAAKAPENAVLTKWRKRLEFLQVQEAVTAGALQRFELQEQIAEAKSRIHELQNG